jgi:hypothetical protein
VSRRATIVLGLAVVAAVAARVAAPTQARVALPSRILICGSERWVVKTLQDKPHLISAKPNTVAHLVSLTRPKPAPVERGQLEVPGKQGYLIANGGVAGLL